MVKLFLLCSALALSGQVGINTLIEYELVNQYQYEEKICFRLENRKMASYNDETYTITLNVNELNTITFTNLGTLLNSYDQDALDSTYIVYNNVNISINEDGLLIDDSFAYYYSQNDEMYLINFLLESDRPTTNKWSFYYINEGAGSGGDSEIEIFQYGFTWHLTSTIYNDIKTAIQADITANTQSENEMPSISDLFTYIVQAIQSFAGALADAFTAITALFWDSTASTPGPTFLGLLVLIGVGVGVVYLVYRVIKGLMHRI